MKKRKVSSSQDVKTQINAEIDSDVVLIENKSSFKKKKGLTILADISHKNTSGANNWQTFLKLNKKKSEGSNNPNLKRTNRPNSKLLPKGEGLKKTHSKPNLESSMISNKYEKPVLCGNEVKSISEVKDKSGERHTKHSKPVLTKQIAMDCEMVGVEVGVKNSIVARVSLVNAHGECIYDKYVKPTEPILDYRTRFSGIRPKDLEDATDFKTVQQEVADIITGRILVGHALKNDLKVLFLSHPRHAMRDTSKFKRFRVGSVPALKNLAKKYLGVTIQDGEHNSVQDALAAMQLYRMFKKEWETSFRQKRVMNQKEKTVASSTLSLD